MPGFKISDLGFEVSSRAEYYYTYTWEIPYVIGRNVSRNVKRNIPLIHLKDATTPTFTVAKENYIGSSLEYKYAKSISWDDVKFTWYDTVGLVDIIREWRQSVWTEQNGLQPADNYKRNTQLICSLPTGLQAYGWNLVGSWPSQIRSGELTYTNSDVKVVEVTISYDWAEDCINDCSTSINSQSQSGTIV